MLVLAALGGALLASDPRAGATTATTRAASPGAILVGPASELEIARTCVAPGKGCKNLTAVTEVPSGTFIDASAGVVYVGIDGADETSAGAVLHGATFSLGRTGATLFARLAGGDYATTCGTRPPPSGAPAKGTKTFPQRSDRIVRELFATTYSGTLEIIGGYASATIAGATTGSAVEDGCNGTNVVSSSRTDTITAKNLRGGTSTKVDAAHPYLARAPELSAKAGESTTAEPVSVPGFEGDVLVCSGFKRNCQTLTGQTLLPDGAHLDTRDGAAKLRTWKRDGTPAHIVTWMGQVKLGFSKGPTLDLTLEGGDVKKACRRARATTRSAGPGAIVPRGSVASAIVRAQRTRGQGQTRTRTKKKKVYAAIDATGFKLSERCNNDTSVRVYEGTVTVVDLLRNKKRKVSAPRTLVIKATRKK